MTFGLKIEILLIRVINFPVANFRENSIYGSSDFGVSFLIANIGKKTRLTR